MSFWQSKSSFPRALLLGGTLLLSALPAAPPAQAGPAATPARLPTYNEARARALQSRRALVLLFGAKWCEPCKEFDRKVLPQPAVQTALGGVVFVHYDGEVEPGREAARELRITGYPTMVALAQDGREIDRLQGYHGAREFIDWIGKVSIDSETEDSLQARIGKNSSDAEAVLVLARRQARRGQEEQAEANFERARTLAQAAAKDSKLAELGASADFELRVMRLRRQLREAPRREMAEHLLAFPLAPTSAAAFHELTRRGPVDALGKRALERYVEARLTTRDAKELEALNYAVYECLRAAAYEAAEKAARRLVEIDGNSPFYLDTLAEVMHLRGERAQAVQLSQKALSLIDKEREKPAAVPLSPAIRDAKALRGVLLKNQARYMRGARELPAELLAEDEELSPWERSPSGS
ncbi:MAG TPA: thioredoxin family protein [Pseudomonadota bacterium]|nr:thioredoxin family protein [Pseudomonadota bacterium]